jgi:hypothetical protein
MSQELRKAINKIEVTGAVKESKLNSGKGDNGNYINGSLVIKAGEFTEVEVKVFVAEKTQEGKVKKAYGTLKQILDKDVKTMADGASEEEAVKVRIWGNGDFTPQFREEMYVTESTPDEVTTRLSLDLGFGNVTLDERITPEDYKATFDVELFIVKIEEEKKAGEETGRVVVKGYTPVHGGSVIPVEIVAGVVEDEDESFDFAEQIRGSVGEQTTINLWGNIDYRSIIVQEKKGGGLGKAKIEEKRTYVHDLVATGGDIIDDVNKEFDEELIRAAVVERENKKQEVLTKSKEKDKDKDKKGKGLGGSGSKDSKGGKNKIPF